MRAYHLSFNPNIKHFTLAKAGTGFGTNFYGLGLYVAFDIDPCLDWAKEAIGMGETPYLYTLDIPDSCHIFPEEAFEKYWDKCAERCPDCAEDGDFPRDVLLAVSTEMYAEDGIDGIRYWNPEDGQSAVIFNPDCIRIVRVEELNAE